MALNDFKYSHQQALVIVVAMAPLCNISKSAYENGSKESMRFLRSPWVSVGFDWFPLVSFGMFRPNFLPRF